MYSSRPPTYGPRVLFAPTLLAQVLGITAVGFLITAVAAYLFHGLSAGVGPLAMLVGFGCLIATNATRRNPAIALLWFYAFAFAEGIGIAPVLARYAAIDGGTVIVQAAATTGVGMALLAGFVWTFSFDWRRLSGIAFGALIALVLVGLLSLFVTAIHPTTYAWLTLAVFTLLTLIDFSRIRAGGDGLTPVDCALMIYLDAINIFLAFLTLFGARSRDD